MAHVSTKEQEELCTSILNKIKTDINSFSIINGPDKCGKSFVLFTLCRMLHIIYGKSMVIIKNTFDVSDDIINDPQIHLVFALDLNEIPVEYIEWKSRPHTHILCTNHKRHRISSVITQNQSDFSIFHLSDKALDGALLFKFKASKNVK